MTPDRRLHRDPTGSLLRPNPDRSLHAGNGRGSPERGSRLAVRRTVCAGTSGHAAAPPRARFADVDAIPASLMVSLRGCSETTATSNSRMDVRALEALDALAREGIPVISFKGPVLAISAYGRLELRKFNDLDLLVRERDADRARTVFASLGYFEIREKRRGKPIPTRRCRDRFALAYRAGPDGRLLDSVRIRSRRGVAPCRDYPRARTRDRLFFARGCALAHCQSSLKNGFIGRSRVCVGSATSQR